MAIFILEAIQLFNVFCAVGVVVIGLGIVVLQEYYYRHPERRPSKRKNKRRNGHDEKTCKSKRHS